MNECKGCNSELNSTDDLIVLEGNRVCPYCFYIYESIDISFMDKHVDLMDVVMNDNIIKQILSDMNNKDYSIASLIFLIISILFIGIIFPLILFFISI